MSRDQKIRWTSIGFGLVGLADSIYLTWLKLSHEVAACGIGDCATVNSSPYSEVRGIPIALLGAGAYLAILAILMLEDRVPVLQSSGREMVFGLTLVGVLYSGWLTYVELAILKAICPFCVISAVVLLIMFVLSIVRFFEPEPESEFA